MVWLEFFYFLHYIGIAWGLGGATTAAIISSKARKYQELTPGIIKIIPAISKLIWIGLLLLIISGIALPYFIKWPINKEMLIIKHVLVIWIVIIGIIIGVNAKKMKRLSNLTPKEKPSSAFIKAGKRVKIFSIINLILWYLVTLLSVFV